MGKPYCIDGDAYGEAHCKKNNSGNNDAIPVAAFEARLKIGHVNVLLARIVRRAIHAAIV